MGAAIEKNFFDFYFPDSLVISQKSGLKIFFEFYTRYSYLGKFFLFFQIVVLCSFDYDLDLLHIVENYGFDIISRFRISDSKFLLVI